MPSYSCRATSDSDISIVEIYYRGPSNVRVSASEGSRRRSSHRGAKVRAKAKIREALVSSQDRADSLYTHGMWVGQRKDTPQVSPSIPLNPATPSVPRTPVAFIAQTSLPSFVPTNELVLTGPSLSWNDVALEALMRRFENASTSAVIGQTGYRSPMAPRSPQVAQSTRRSFLKTAQPPTDNFRENSRQSHYWPNYKTWRKFVAPREGNGSDDSAN